MKFSLKESWKKIMTTSNNDEFNRLKSIQGIRVFTMNGVIASHVILMMTLLFSTNPEILEEVSDLNECISVIAIAWSRFFKQTLKPCFASSSECCSCH